jgi:ABC-type bacteriocin/lantibiotic exporter with double-glycine peptidase domain
MKRVNFRMKIGELLIQPYYTVPMVSSLLLMLLMYVKATLRERDYDGLMALFVMPLVPYYNCCVLLVLVIILICRTVISIVHFKRHRSMKSERGYLDNDQNYHFYIDGVKIVVNQSDIYGTDPQ